MSQNLKPIQVWGQGGPNPPKVALILEELGVPHTIVPLPFDHVKDPEYLNINPNGRLPAIIDPNTGITLWESGAIVEYLVEKYDANKKISFERDSAEYWHAKQWLQFQTSGQGPYFGQIYWFKNYHPEKLPSAVERYVKEANRVIGVLESWLEKQKAMHGDKGDGPWLVSDKKSYADIAFVSWHVILPRALSKEEFDEDAFPLVKEWMGKMTDTEVVKKVWNNAKRENIPKFEGFEKYLQM